MEKKLTCKESYDFVNKYRFVEPNYGFIKQLLIFEQKLKDSNYDLDQVNLSGVNWPLDEGFI